MVKRGLSGGRGSMEWEKGVERGLSRQYLAWGRARVLFVLFIRPTGFVRVIIESGLLQRPGRDYTSLFRLTHRKWRVCKRCCQEVADRTVELRLLLRENFLRRRVFQGSIIGSSLSTSAWLYSDCFSRQELLINLLMSRPRS